MESRKGSEGIGRREQRDVTIEAGNLLDQPPWFGSRLFSYFVLLLGNLSVGLVGERRQQHDIYL